MRTTSIIFVCLFLLSGNLLFAQNAGFVSAGTIEFEKSINMYAIINKSWFGDWRSSYQGSITRYKNGNQPQFKILKSSLAFSGDKTLFTPAKTDPDPYSGTYVDSRPLVDQNNTIYTDLAANSSTIQKSLYEETYLVKDNPRKITWKITDETREIAGYSCRRANGLMMDSIYVVAFYTGEIPVPGGPESFTGLPGMILGVALPYENMTWFAKKVTPTTLSGTEIKPLVPPKKAKIVTSKEMKTILETSPYIKQWGKAYLQLYLKGFLL